MFQISRWMDSFSSWSIIVIQQLVICAEDKSVWWWLEPCDGRLKILNYFQMAQGIPWFKPVGEKLEHLSWKTPIRTETTLLGQARPFSFRDSTRYLGTRGDSGMRGWVYRVSTIEIKSLPRNNGTTTYVQTSDVIKSFHQNVSGLRRPISNDTGVRQTSWKNGICVCLFALQLELYTWKLRLALTQTTFQRLLQNGKSQKARRFLRQWNRF